MKFSLFSTLVLCLLTFVSGNLAAAVPTSNVLQNDVLGSVLIFSKFDIRQDRVTQLRIVNNGDNIQDITGNYPDLKVKLNYVCPGVKHVNDFCAALNTVVTFTPHQTRVIDVADQNPPCNQGFVVAYAMNPDNSPANYNYLSGSSTISSERRLEGDNAIAIRAQAQNGECFDCSEQNVRGASPLFPDQLIFGPGAPYQALPTRLYTDFRAVDGDLKAGSTLVLLSLNVLAGMQNPAAAVFIDFWNAAEVPFSTSHEFVCWSEIGLEDIDANFLSENLGTTFGSMTLFGVENCPIPGGCPPLVPYDAAILGSIQEYGEGVTNTRNLVHDECSKEAVFVPR